MRSPIISSSGELSLEPHLLSTLLYGISGRVHRQVLRHPHLIDYFCSNNKSVHILYCVVLVIWLFVLQSFVKLL